MGRDSEIAEIGRAIKTHNKHTRDTNGTYIFDSLGK